MEEEFVRGHTSGFFAQVREDRDSFTACKATIKNKNVKDLTEQQYVELYINTNTPLTPAKYALYELKPLIFEEEVIWTLEQLPNNKAPAMDTIPVELLRPIPSAAIIALCQKIWEIGQQIGKHANRLEKVCFHPVTKERCVPDYSFDFPCK
ncbi:uncharacterized protein LOC142322762 [Lycorma delicatula]|uniref:uncharacterized protein LOC142322762 n=1 Tax=Lycorma delicatula TaxID=130591 RepID=UPI003F5185C8